MSDGVLAGFSRQQRPQLSEFAEVLDGCGYVELVLGAVRSSEAKAVEPEYALQVGEEHLDLLSGIARGGECQQSVLVGLR